MTNIIYSEKNASVRSFFSTVINQWKNCSVLMESDSLFKLTDKMAQPDLSAFVLLGLDQPTYGDLLSISTIKNKFPALKVIGISQRVDKFLIKKVI